MFFVERLEYVFVSMRLGKNFTESNWVSQTLGYHKVVLLNLLELVLAKHILSELQQISWLHSFVQSDLISSVKWLLNLAT
jgi:hypothetical protein